MPGEFCPHCRTVANMNVTVIPRAIAGAKMTTITTKTYHCESCGAFVRSIDEEKETSASVA
jgi:hypothetical protein